MSRLLSFLKKKDKDVGLEYTNSPPPSPKPDKEHKEAKSVKQIKKRHHRRDKRKAPLPEAGGGAAPIVDVQEESLGHSLVDDTVDANGNSMTGKGKAAALDNGDITTALITKSTEGEADSLRDVDSICEDDTSNGLVSGEIDNTVVSAEPYFVGGVNPDLEEAGIAENGTGEDGSPAPTQLPVASEGCGTSGAQGLEYVSSFSDSGDNILIDDIMDEALDDLEDDLDNDNRDDLNGTIESSDTTDKEESLVRLATPVNSYPEADSSNVESNSNLPCENGSLVDSSSNGPACIDISDRSTSVCAERLLSTDTVGTVYSSCDAGSDYFESAFEDLPPSTNGGEPIEVLDTVDGCVVDGADGGNTEPLEVRLRPKSISCANYDLNSSAEFTDADVAKLEVCFELQTQGRASTIVADIIEARNCLVETADGDQAGITETVDQTKAHDESSDALEVSLGSDTLRHAGDTSHKQEDDSPQNLIGEDNDREIEENETQAPSSTFAEIVAELAEEGARERLHSSDDTGPQLESSEVRPIDPSVVSDAKDVRGRPESVGAEVDTNAESSQALGDSPVSVGDICNVTEHSDTNLVNGDDVSEVDRKDVVEMVTLDNTSRSDTDELNDTGCDERTCDYTNEGIPEKGKCSVVANADSTAASDDQGLPPASDTASSIGDDDGKQDGVRALHCEDGAVEDGEAEAEKTKLVFVDESEQIQHEPTLSPDVTAGSEAIENGSKEATSEPPLNLNVTAHSEASESSSSQTAAEPPLSPDVSSSSATLSTPSGSSRKSSRALKKEASLEDELEKHGANLDDQAEAQLAQRRAARAEARELRLKELERQQQQNPPENADDASDMSAQDQTIVAATGDANISTTNDTTMATDDTTANTMNATNDTTMVADDSTADTMNATNDTTMAADDSIANTMNATNDSILTADSDCTLTADSKCTLSNTSTISEESALKHRRSQSFSSASVGREGGALARRSSSGAWDRKEVQFPDLDRFSKYRRSFTDVKESRKEKEESEFGDGSSFKRFDESRKSIAPTRSKDVEFGDLSRFYKYRRPKSSSSLDKGDEGEFTKVFRKSSSSLSIGETIKEHPSGGQDSAGQVGSYTQRGLPGSGQAVFIPISFDEPFPTRPMRHSTSLEGGATGGFLSLADESPARPSSALDHRAPPSDMVGVGARRKSFSSDCMATKSPLSPRAPSLLSFNTAGPGPRSPLADGGSGGRLGSRSSASRTPAPSAVPPPPPPPHYSRRSSEESNNDEPACKDVRELEEKFRVAMINNASLDNDKTRLTFQIEELKDSRTDLTEQLTQLKKEHKKKCSEHEQLRKVYAKLQEESRAVRRVLEERDELIQEYGLVVVGGDDEEEEDGGDDEEDEALAAREETEDGLVLPRPVPMKRVLLTQEAAEILQQGAAKGSLEWRLRRVVERKRELEDELRRVNLELAEQVNTQRQSNCNDSNIQKEANKTVNEYKFRVQKAEAEVSSLQANVNRLEALVTRYKVQTEELERSEEELKAEKRRLQRELREATNRLDELETANSHLVRRFELLRNARSNLLREMSQDPI